MKRGLYATALVVGLGAVACASVPVPSDQLAAAQANVARAQQMGANENSDASYHLQLAQQQLDQGEQLIAKKDNLEAKFVLKRAAADAELAMAIANYGTASSEADQARQRLQNLQSRQNSNSMDQSPNSSGIDRRSDGSRMDSSGMDDGTMDNNTSGGRP